MDFTADKDDAGQDRKAVFAAAVAAAVKAYMLGEGIDVTTAASEAINTTTEICIGVLKDAGGEAADDSEGKAQEGGGPGMFPPLPVSSLPVLYHIHFIFPILMTPLLRPSYSFLLNSYSSPLHTFPPHRLSIECITERRRQDGPRLGH